ncbi:hypothetical protein BKA70DRAFT_1414794 [Coprinopsis sp. MPI-PUGE-AT-0042]|nr:hypothetical protein BKA70DRAFT_1414794 [Coprinopsis sp. MPI-PUGE-AT-0042]
MSKLSTRLIQRARAGSPAHLQELSRCLTTENYTVAALDAALAQLNVNGCSKHPSLITSDMVLFHRIILAIHLVDMSIGACHSTTELKAATLSRLQENLDGLVAWMSLILDQMGTFKAYIGVGSTLLHLICLDDQLGLCVFSLPEAAALILKLWFYEPTVNDEASDLWIPPAIALVHNWLLHADAKELIYDIILRSKRQLSTFLDALLFRIRQLIDTFHPLMMKGAKLDQHVESLLNIFLLLDRRAVLSRTKRSLCLKGLATVASLLLPPKIPVATFLDNAVLILHLAKDCRDFAPILESGLLEVLVDVFPNCEWEGEARNSQLTHILGLIASKVCYPRGLPDLIATTSRLVKNPKVNPKNNLWFSLAHVVKEKLDLLPSVTLDILTCDNEFCPRRVPRDAALPIKACSGCHFMVYCSAVCQRVDWRYQHHFVCVELRYTSQRRHDAMRISQRTKAFHLSIAKELFHDPQFREYCNVQIGAFPYHVSELAITHNMSFPEFPYKTMGVSSWDEWLEKQPKDGAYPALKSRVSSFVRETRAGMMNQSCGGISALELAMEWNQDYFLSLLVRFEEEAQGLFSPVRSVLRVVKKPIEGSFILKHVK